MGLYQKRAGFGLAEVVVILSLLGMALYGMIRFMGSFQKSISTSSIQSTRDLMFKRLIETATEPVAIQKAASLLAATSPLNQCLQSSSPSINDCVVTDYAYISLSDANGVALSGTDSAPIRYSIDGSPCTTVSQNCPWEAFSEFKAICQGGSASCDQALQLQFRMTFRPSPSLDRVVASSVTLKTKTFEKTVNVRDISLLGAQQCSDPNQVQQGYDQYGKIICGYPSSSGLDCNSYSFVSGVHLVNNQLAVTCRPATIACQQAGSMHLTKSTAGTIYFTAADCGGILPDGTYFGAISKIWISGGTNTFEVVSLRTASFVGVSFTCSDGISPTQPYCTTYDIRAIYTKLH